MKKIIFGIVVFLFPIYVMGMSAESYVVMDADSFRVIDGENINKPKLIASTSKIMTAIIIIENVKLSEEILVDNEVLKSFGSNIYLSPGEKMTVEALLYGLLLRSGNDAALVLANYYAGDMNKFALIMNQYAQKIGMKNTKFINSSGLENNDGIGNISSSYDMALLLAYCINNPVFNKISSTKKYRYKSNFKTYDWTNKNKLLFSYDKIIAGKTGFTKKAKRTLVSAARDDNKTIIIVTLNDGNDFFDHLTTYQKIFKEYKNYNPCEKIKKIDDPDNIYKDFLLDYKKDCKILLNSRELEKLNIVNELFIGIKPVTGEIVGSTNVFLGSDLINNYPILLEEKRKINIFSFINRGYYD